MLFGMLKVFPCEYFLTCVSFSQGIMYSNCKLDRNVSLILRLDKLFISVHLGVYLYFPLSALLYLYLFHLICLQTQACMYLHTLRFVREISVFKLLFFCNVTELG